MKPPRSIIGNLRKLMAIMWHEDKALLVAYLSTSVLGALLLYVVYFAYKLMIDQVAGVGQTSGVVSVQLIIITYLFFEYVSRFVNYTFNNYYFEYVIRVKFQNVLTRNLLRKLAELDFAQLEDGDVRNLIAKVQSSYESRLPEILTKTNATLYNIAALIFSLLIAFRFNITYFLALALVSVPIYYLRAKYGNVSWQSYSLNAPKTNYLTYIKYLFTNFTSLNEIKIYGLGSHFIDKTKQLQEEVLNDYIKPIRKYTLMSSISFILIPIAIYFSISRFIEYLALGQRSIGDFTFFLNTLFTFSGQISSILINVGSLYENNLYADDYFKLIGIKPKLRFVSIQWTKSELDPKLIEFRNVGFHYPGSDRASIEHINFSIAKGQNIALVGKNGAGKSTLVKLLLRFYDPTEGGIFIDGVNLADIPLDVWYQHVGILFQDFARYYLSLKENIAFGNVHKQNPDQLKRAFAEVEGDELLSVLPEGYDQILGRWFEGGVELSGGQWQKVAIARAIYRNAPILILDEPTSAIDAETEAHIFDHLNDIYSQKTLMFISHRFSTVRNADRIMVLNKGRLVEEGNHHQLLNDDGLYAHYFRLQRRGYE